MHLKLGLPFLSKRIQGEMLSYLLSSEGILPIYALAYLA